ncbi:dimethylarginine dimethylaminohydrolase [Altererythrobacter arenosus]|uniref:Dimethylarginine dimethylaminohydrolase n=1 Tax=Altererythrobacter arenosus TaxID=3032592 RepID=A0ABY8FRD9_9SPHN|nr:arginine deiminase family protein [Altererythrobacter sp. CAU 1644]WFL76795.1 dimethylarginine dimethylaminohydrolase [Altererythrobacter sp. CAU 1644]
MGFFDFTNALLRKPATSVTDGLRDGDHDGPAYDDVAREHAAYAGALRELGLEVEVLPPLESFPDSIFVEDPALVFGEGAILLNPGAPTRAGEVAEIAPELERRFERVLTLAEGHVDGGDILTTPDEVLIGLSARTDADGAKALIAALAVLGLSGRVVTTPPGVLHFKTGCGLIDEETVAVIAELDDQEMFGSLRRVVIPANEAAAANLLRVRGTVLIGEGFPKARELVEALGVKTQALPVSEIGKIDAGLSCMSLRWQAA